MRTCWPWRSRVSFLSHHISHITTSPHHNALYHSILSAANLPPVISSEGDTIQVNLSVSVAHSVSVSDDTDTVPLSLVSAPSGSSVSPGQPGSYTFTWAFSGLEEEDEVSEETLRVCQQSAISLPPPSGAPPGVLCHRLPGGHWNLHTPSGGLRLSERRQLHPGGRGQS